jgi:hypothetical protein
MRLRWDDKDRPQEPATATRDPRTEQQLALVSFGLGCHSLRLLLLFINCLAVAALVLVLRSDPSFAWVSIGIGLLSLAAMLLAFIGSCCCLGVPEQARARGWMAASLVLDVIFFLGGVVIFISLVPDRVPLRGGNAGFTGLVGALLGLASWWCYTVFLQRLAGYLWDPELVSLTGSVQVFGIILAVAAGMLCLGAYALFPLETTGSLARVIVTLAVGLFGLCLPIAFVVFLLVQFRLLQRLREAMWSRR